jgi:hypothetical protein
MYTVVLSCGSEKKSAWHMTITQSLYRHSSVNAVFWAWKNCVKGVPRYRRNILVVKPQNREFVPQFIFVKIHEHF